LRTLGYAEMSDFLDRKTTLAEAKDLVALHTLQFAKRQKTWFNGAGNIDRAIHWISPTTDSIDSMFKNNATPANFGRRRNGSWS